MRSDSPDGVLQSNQRNSTQHAQLRLENKKKMAKAVRFYETGGPEVLRYEEVDVGDPGPGQVRLRHVAVGLNYADTYFRNGTYPIPMPNGMGGLKRPVWSRPSAKG